MWHTLLNKGISSCVVITLVVVTGVASCRRADKAVESNKAVERAADVRITGRSRRRVGRGRSRG
jgi:hypothetical protein